MMTHNTIKSTLSFSQKSPRNSGKYPISLCYRGDPYNFTSWLQDKLTLSQLKILKQFMNYSPCKSVFPSIATLAEGAGVNARTVNRALIKLESLGLLLRKRRAYRSNGYELASYLKRKSVVKVLKVFFINFMALQFSLNLMAAKPSQQGNVAVIILKENILIPKHEKVMSDEAWRVFSCAVGLQLAHSRGDERWSLAGMVSRVDGRPHDTFPFFQKGEKSVCESVLTSISVPDTPSEWDFRVSGNEVNAQEPISRPSQGVLVVQESIVHNESYEAIKKELGRWPLTLKGMLKLSCYPVEVVSWLIGQEPPLEKKDPFTYSLKMCSNRCRELGLPFPNYAKYDQAERELDLKSEPWMDVERVKELLAAKKKATHKPAQEFSYSAGYDKWGTKRPDTLEEMEAVRLETIKKLEDMKAAGTLNVFAQIVLDSFTKNDPNAPANPLIPNGPTKAEVAQLLGNK